LQKQPQFYGCATKRFTALSPHKMVYEPLMFSGTFMIEVMAYCDVLPVNWAHPHPVF